MKLVKAYQNGVEYLFDEWKRLPSAYQEVEYIQSSGTQRIDTGFKPTGDTKYVVDYLSISKGTSPMGCYNNPSGYGLVINTISNSYQNEVHYGTTSENSFNKYCDTRSVQELSNVFVYNGVTQYTFTKLSFQMNINCWLFGWNRNGTSSNNGSVRMWSCKIYDGTTLKRDFVPCYRKSDNVIGMYDIVNNTFYTNAGTGTFTKGPNV